MYIRNPHKQHVFSVYQDIYLLDDSIKNNIAFGINPDEIDQESILKSLNLSLFYIPIISNILVLIFCTKIKFVKVSLLIFWLT